MRKIAAALLSAVLAVSAPVTASADAYHNHPRLVVILVIDQFRGDMLERYRDQLTAENGFNLFLKKGAYFNSCYYNYASTKTAPGHAAIGTGAYSNLNGIASNDWWDLSRSTERTVSSVDDERYSIVGTFDDLPVPEPPAISPAAKRIGASPFNLKATTVGDELRLATSGASRVYGVSLKDRAAILPSGQSANGAFWIDNTTGRFVTSTYYMQQLPEWATKFNKGPRPMQAIKEAGLDETTQFYALVGRTPAANSYEFDFARTLIENEKLGQGDVTDMITVSLSANDILGHQLGPDADTQKQMVLTLDKQLDAFFSYLDKKIPGGLSNVEVAFTADHGIAPIVSKSRALGIASASIDIEALTTAIDATINKKLSIPEGTRHFLPILEFPNLALDPRTFGTLTEGQAEDMVVAAEPAALASLSAPPPAMLKASTPEGSRTYLDSRAPADPSIVFIRTHVQLANGDVPNTDFGHRIANSFTDHGGWYVMMVPQGYQMETLQGIQTVHFSPWSYDRHVPLGFFGPDFAPGFYRQQVEPIDIAPTLSSLLGINAPSASVGHILLEAIKPAK